MTERLIHSYKTPDRAELIIDRYEKLLNFQIDKLIGKRVLELTTHSNNDLQGSARRIDLPTHIDIIRLQELYYDHTMDFPVDSDNYDFVIGLYPFHNIPINYCQKIINESIRALKTGGEAYFGPFELNPSREKKQTGKIITPADIISQLNPDQISIDYDVIPSQTLYTMTHRAYARQNTGSVFKMKLSKHATG